MVASLLLNPFIALHMQNNDYAITGYYNSFNLLILPLVSFSFIQYYSKSYFKYSEEERGKLMSTIVSAQIVFGSINLLIINVLFYFYLNSTNLDFPYLPFSIFSFGTVFLSSFSSLYLVQLKFQRRSRTYLIISCASTFFWIIAMSMGVIFLDKGALGYLSAIFLAALVMAIYSVIKMLKHFYIDWGILKSAFLFSWPIILANMMEYVYMGIDRSFLANLHDNHQLGLYNVAVSIGLYVSIFYTALSQTFQPDIFEAISQKNTLKVLKIVLIIQILNIIPILLFVLFAPLLIDILTCGRYIDAAPYVRIIALKGISAGLYFSVSSIIIAAGLSKITLINKILGTVLVYFLYSYLIEHFTYIGAAWGQATSYIVMFIISLVFIFCNRKKVFG